ncbi:MAG: hypothetical protein ABI336_01775 [Humibacillus sp.]
MTEATVDWVQLEHRWRAAWPEALACWGPSLRLAEPRFLTPADPSGTTSFAWFDMDSVGATIDLRAVVRLGIEDVALPVLAHEIGHHVLAPADATGRARIVERCRRGLVDRDTDAPLMSNLWTDLLINDRLTRLSGLDMTAPYRASRSDVAGGTYFDVYLRAYELLWSLPARSLVPALGPAQEVDAGFLSRHARVFARDPVGGAGGFAALMRRWLPEPSSTGLDGPCHVTGGRGSAPDVAEDDSLAGPPRHPALDPRVNSQAPDPGPTEGAAAGAADSAGQVFGPADLAALYETLGVTRDAAADWYVARARRHLVPFPVDREQPDSEPELQGLETWQLGDDLTDLDWVGTSLRSATVLPGLTTQRRVVESAEGQDTVARPVDLDLYVDSSGSMPQPRGLVSPAVLGGVVLVLSALRAGARVRVTSWSSPGQVTSSGPLGTDRDLLLGALLTYHGGGTSFPLHDLAGAHEGRPADRGTRRRCHVTVISDDGVESMFGRGQSDGLDTTAARALERAGGGGTLVLRVAPQIAEKTRAMAGDYVVEAVATLDDVVSMARHFARRHWHTGPRRSPR